MDIPGVNYLGLMMFSFVGAGLGAALVFGFTSFSRGGIISVKLALAGSALSPCLAHFLPLFCIHWFSKNIDESCIGRKLHWEVMNHPLKDLFSKNILTEWLVSAYNNI
ncbi:hypothetical protein ACQKFG_25570 [Peribacillus sp. NPDC076916]|uniref:hypothetical protein n=1 Tax=Peribacillus sp. NPDC076916 TaxID=3390608 RepID=UPI003D0654AB